MTAGRPPRPVVVAVGAAGAVPGALDEIGRGQAGRGWAPRDPVALEWAALEWAAPEWAAPEWAAPEWAAPEWAAPGGAAPDGAALEWAAAEAATRGCALRVVHAVCPPLLGDAHGLIGVADGLLAARAGAEHVLADAVAHVRSVAPDLAVSTRVLVGAPARALLDETDGARLLVLGGRGGRRDLPGLRAGSVPGHVSARARCPVIVVPARQNLGRQGTAGQGTAGQGTAGQDTAGQDTARQGAARTAPRVVVGVDAAGRSSAAIGFAFRAARQRGVPLVAVHAWEPDLPADLEAVRGPEAMAEAAARRLLGRALDRWQCRFTAVPVTTALVRGDPVRALITRSRGAALLVVGSRGRGPLMGALLGSVDHAVLRHADSPVAVVRAEGPAPAPVAPDRRPAARRRWPGQRDASADRRPRR